MISTKRYCQRCSHYDDCCFVSRGLEYKCDKLDSFLDVDYWIDAQGNDLPEYDREVVVLIQDYPDDEEHLRVAYGHRPNPNGYVTKDGGKLYPMTYGKGGWNGKNVRYWLDVKLPNQD